MDVPDALWASFWLTKSFKDFFCIICGRFFVINDLPEDCQRSAYLGLSIFLPYFTFLFLVILQIFFRVTFPIPLFYYFLLTIACVMVVPILRLGNAIDWYSHDHYRDLRYKSFLQTYIHFCNGSSKSLLVGILFCMYILFITPMWDTSSIVLIESDVIDTKKQLFWCLFFNLTIDTVSDSLNTKSERGGSWITQQANKQMPQSIKIESRGVFVWLFYEERIDRDEDDWEVIEEKTVPWYMFPLYYMFWFIVQFLRLSWEYKCLLVSVIIVVAFDPGDFLMIAKVMKRFSTGAINELPR